MSGHRPEMLQNLVEMPKNMKYLWGWFLDLNATRPSGFGVGSIQYQEIDAYFRLHGIEPESWEIGVLKLFDSIAISINREQESKNKPTKSKS